MTHLVKLLVRLDMAINDTLLRGRLETISGRCYRRKAKGCLLCRWLCNRLNVIDPNHCRKAYFNDRIRNPDLPWF